MKTILSILLMHLLVLPVFAQTIIKGKVINQDTQEKIALAAIHLFKFKNNEFIKSTLSSDLGEFNIELSDNPTLYYLKVTAAGYELQNVPLKDYNPIEVTLIQDSIQNILDEVVVVGKKKAISIKGDKIIYDMEQLGIGMGSNGLETMQQLPGISLDKDENIQYRGSTGLQIMINGKKSMLQGDALREFIRTLRSEDIQSVEIISQPSARYEATGTTGILNIVLKRNTSKMVGGSINTNASYGKYFGALGAGRFFYNDEKWSLNSSASYYKGKSFNDRLVNQTIQLENDQRNLMQSNYWLPSTESKSINVALERKINKNQLISTEWKWNNSNEDARTTGKTLDYLNALLQNEVMLTKENKTPVNQFSGNIFYNYTSDSSTTKIDAQMNYGYYNKSASGYQQNEYTNGDTDKLEGSNQTRYNMMNMQLDWTQKLAKNFEIETGAKFSFIDMNYFNQYKPVLGTNFIIPDSLMTNDFTYKEKLNSAYTQFSYSVNKWNFMAGVRMENYHYDATSKINLQSNSNSYTNWFPSASINYQNDKHQYRLSYSKRISRPAYLTLNPYFQYLDAFSIERGNPDLKPQMYHSFEANYIYKNSLSFGLFGYLYIDGFVEVLSYQKEENYNVFYTNNASTGSNFGFSASFPYEVGKWWSMQYGFNAFINKEKSEIENYTYDGSGHGYELNMYHRFSLPKKWVITWNGYLNGRNKTSTGYSPLVYDFSASVRKSILNEKFQIVAGCSNFLKNNMWNSYSTVNNVTTHWVNKWETRKFYVQLTYRFGGNKEKKIKNTKLDEEQNRM